MANRFPPQRALRVGVLLGDNLVEERLFRTPGPISIGQSLRCTLSIPIEGIPGEHVLFATDDGRLQLRVTANMTGRLARGPEIRTELREGPGDGGIWTIPIEQGTRGKLHLAPGVTLLFQELAAPPPAPRPRLPASVRGTFADRVDGRLAVIIAGSLLVHVAIGSWAWLTERVREPTSMPELASYEPPTVEQIDFAMPELPPAPTPSDPEPGKPAAARPTNPGRQTPRAIPRPEQLPDPADADRFAQMLTGNTASPDGGEEIKKRLPGAELERQIEEIRENDRNVKVGGSTRTTRDPGVRRGTGHGPDIDGPTELARTEKKDREPVGRLTPLPTPPNPERPTLTPQMVLVRIQGSYMGGLKRCYVKHGLAVDANLVANVTLAFVVDDHGAATENSARGANAEVDSCIRDQMSGWRFPVPKDRDGNPTDAPFKVQLALQPS